MAQRRPLPDTTQPIDFGQTQSSVAPGSSTLFEFSIEEPQTVNLTVIPVSPSFDVTIDLLDGESLSLAPEGLMVDEAGAGSAESLEEIALEPGSYQILVRGFALTGGAFTVELAR